MIEVRAELREGLTRIEVAGHEGHQADGRVCAAVSAITQTALLGLQQIAHRYPHLVTIEITED